MPWQNELARQCRESIDSGGGHAEILVLVRRALAGAGDVLPQEEIDRIVYRSSDLLVVSLAQPAYGNTPIHSHGIWCVIGVASGNEDNAFYSRNLGGLVETGRIRLSAGNSIALGSDVIHKIRNPDGAQSQVVHIYGGDLLSASRSMWSPHTMQESKLEQAQFEAWCEELTAAASDSTGVSGGW